MVEVSDVSCECDTVLSGLRTDESSDGVLRRLVTELAECFDTFVPLNELWESLTAETDVNGLQPICYVLQRVVSEVTSDPDWLVSGDDVRDGNAWVTALRLDLLLNELSSEVNRAWESIFNSLTDKDDEHIGTVKEREPVGVDKTAAEAFLWAWSPLTVRDLD